LRLAEIGDRIGAPAHYFTGEAAVAIGLDPVALHLLKRIKLNYDAKRSHLSGMAAQSAAHWEWRHAGRAARF